MNAYEYGVVTILAPDLNAVLVSDFTRGLQIAQSRYNLYTWSPRIRVIAAAKTRISPRASRTKAISLETPEARKHSHQSYPAAPKSPK